jgi:hypothetical protein
MPIEVDMMLCQAATIADGSISLLGAGWQVRLAQPLEPSAIAVVIRVPRKSAGTHDLRFELLDYEGGLVEVAPPDGPGPLVAGGRITIVGRKDPKLKTPLLAGFAVNLPPFRLDQGTEYQWRLHVDGKTRPAWVLPFRTTSAEEESAQLAMLQAQQGPQP